jgi:hypothetical protein
MAKPADVKGTAGGAHRFELDGRLEQGGGIGAYSSAGSTMMRRCSR